MPSLFNKASGQSENIPDAQVEGALSSGQYALPQDYVAAEGSRIRVISPDGKYGTVPAPKFKEYLGLGYRLANDADKFATGDMGTAAAIGMGAASGATLGASNWLGAKMFGGDYVEALRKAHPTATTAAELTSALGTALLGNFGGELDALKLAEAAKAADVVGPTAEGGKLLKNTLGALRDATSWTPTSAAAGFAQRAVDPLAKTLIAELTGAQKLGVVSSALMRGAALMPGAAIEGGLWGINQALTEKALGDPREAGAMLTEVVWPSIGYSALTAGALGAIGGLVGGTVSKLAKKVETKLASADELMLSAAEKGVAEQLGLTPYQMGNLRERVGAGFSALYDESLLPDGSVFQKRGPTGEMVTVSAKEAATRARLAHWGSGGVVGQMYQTAQELAESKVPQAAVAKLEEEWGAAMGEARRAKMGSPEQQAATTKAFNLRTQLDTVANEGPWPSVKRMVEQVKGNKAAGIEGLIDAEPDVASGRALRRQYQEFVTYLGDKTVLPYDELQALKKTYSRKGFAGSADESAQAEAGRNIWHIMQDEALAAAQKSLSPAEMTTLRRANDTYSKLDGVVEAMDHISKMDPDSKQIAQLFKRWGYMNQWNLASAMRKVVGGGLGAGAGALVGGFPGAVVGTGAALGAEYIAGKALPSAIDVGVIASKAARLGTMAERVNEFDGRVQKAIAGWLRGAKAGAALTPHMIGAGVLSRLGRDTDPRRALRKVQMKVAALQEPEAMGQYLEESLGGMRSVAPQTALHSAATISRGVAEMNRIFAPEQLMRQPSMQPHLKLQPDVSDGRLEEIGLRVGAVTRPLDTMEEILSGKATQPQIESFVRVHPDLWAYMMRSVATQLAAHKEPLGHTQKQLLAKLGFRDWETPPWLQQAAAAIYQQPAFGAQQPGMGMAPRPPAPALTALSRLDRAFAGHQGKPLDNSAA